MKVSFLAFLIFQTILIVSLVMHLIKVRKIAKKEENYKAFFEALPDLIFVFDRECKYTVFWTGSKDNLFKPKEELAGKSIVEIFGQEKGNWFQERIMKAFEENELQVFEYELDVPLGKRWFEARISPVTQKNSKVPDRVVSIARDITERKIAEIELKKHKKHLDDVVEEKTLEMKKALIKAEDANRAKTEFLANINHEIRTPLNIISGFATILKDNLKNDKESLEAVDNIDSACVNLTELIGDILDISKIEAGKMILAPDFIDIHGIFTEIKKAYRPLAKKKKLEFKVKVDKSVPKVVKLDGIRVRQILYNLVGNAFKFTETGEIKVSLVSTVSNEKNKVDLILSVKDTGIGIPENQIRIKTRKKI